MFYITVSRPYPNATPHLGTAMDGVYADSLSRFFKRYESGNCIMTMGMDDHSGKIVDAAIKENLTPKQLVDQKYNEFKEIYSNLDVLPDDFSQTSTLKHHWLANIVWKRLVQKDLIYKKDFQGLYCKGCEDFKTQSQIAGGKCEVHPYLELEKIIETNYFFKLSSFKDQLTNFLEAVFVPDESIIIEQKNFVKKLEDIPISRPKDRLAVEWGITIWQDKTQTMYVWFEALLSYLTCVINDDLFDDWEKANIEGKGTVEESVFKSLSRTLPVDLMIMGRDNSKFHLVVWPALLLGLDLPLPKAGLIHGMINDSQGRKFSKSLGNGVDLVDFYSKVGKEGVRFFVLHDCNPVGDTSFDWNRVIDSHNANLSNNLGNLVVRVSNLIEKNLDGFVDIDNLETDQKAYKLLKNNLDEVYKNLLQYDTQTAFQMLLGQSTKINQYLEETKPWMLAKNFDINQGEIKFILTSCVKALIEISEALSIFLPETGDKIHQIFTQPKITKAQSLFPKIEPEVI